MDVIDRNFEDFLDFYFFDFFDFLDFFFEDFLGELWECDEKDVWKWECEWDSSSSFSSSP